MIRIIYNAILLLLLATASGCAMLEKQQEKYYACKGRVGEVNNGQDKTLYEDILTFRVIMKNDHGTVKVIGNVLPSDWEGMYYICEKSDVAIYFEHMPVNIHQCYGSNTARLGSINLVTGEGRLQLVTGKTPADASTYFDYVCKESGPGKN